MKRLYWYIHSINGRPASFDGKLILFNNKIKTVADNIHQIKREQKINIKNRKKEGSVDNDVYGYFKVAVNPLIY
jgi:hypothetical protein